MGISEWERPVQRPNMQGMPCKENVFIGENLCERQLSQSQEFEYYPLKYFKIRADKSDLTLKTCTSLGLE